jgi:hypothetical protein
MKMGVLCSSGKRATEKVIKSPYSKEKPFFGKKIQTHAISSCIKNFIQQWISFIIRFLFSWHTHCYKSIW